MRVQSDYVLVKRKPPSTLTKGGVMLPENSAKRSFEFIVVGVGPKVSIELKANDVVVIDVNQAKVTLLDDQELIYVKEQDIVGIL
jgi:co-chaperonin GroES (HSP10)